MRVGWVHDDPGYVGGAELTMAEFRRAAPCEVVDCPPGGVVEGLDAYVVGNCSSYSPDDLPAFGYGAPVVRYHHDVQPRFMDAFFTLNRVTHVFCSPMQRERMGMEGECIPPALDLEHLRQVRQAQDLMGEERKGAVWLGMHPNHPGKGLDLALEWTRCNGEMDIYGNATANGLVPYEDVPRVLARYKVFAHVPRALEPFGRSVVEAWAVGCELVINGNVGARHYIENEPEKLESAGEDFWKTVLS